jgi:hypothetical protein
MRGMGGQRLAGRTSGAPAGEAPEVRPPGRPPPDAGSSA